MFGFLVGQFELASFLSLFIKKTVILVETGVFQGAADLTTTLGACAKRVQSINSTGVKIPPIVSTGWLSSHVSNIVDPSFSMWISKFIQDLMITDDEVMVSFDVVSLFTLILQD